MPNQAGDLLNGNASIGEQRDEAAARLNLDPKTEVCVVRRHVRYIDGKPAILSDDYLDERIVRGTELAEPEDTTRENILAEAGYENRADLEAAGATAGMLTNCPFCGEGPSDGA